MSFGTRIGAWWSAWKWIVILAGLLAGSVWMNLQQWRAAGTRAARAEAAAYRDVLDRVGNIARDRNRDDAELLTALEALVERGRTTRIVYQQAAAAAPLPQQCAPGPARVDAVNDILGPVGPVTGERK